MIEGSAKAAQGSGPPLSVLPETWQPDAGEGHGGDRMPTPAEARGTGKVADPFALRTRWRTAGRRRGRGAPGCGHVLGPTRGRPSAHDFFAATHLTRDRGTPPPVGGGGWPLRFGPGSTPRARPAETRTLGPPTRPRAWRNLKNDLGRRQRQALFCPGQTCAAGIPERRHRQLPWHTTRERPLNAGAGPGMRETPPKRGVRSYGLITDMPPAPGHDRGGSAVRERGHGSELPRLRSLVASLAVRG